MLLFLLALLRAAVALAAVAALSLVGFAVIPAGLRPRRRAVTAIASVSIGALVTGWTAWIAGVSAGPRVIAPMLAIEVMLALLRLREWLSVTRAGLRFCLALARSAWPVTIVLAITLAFLLPQLVIPVVDSDGLHYHLGFPKLYLLSGEIRYNQWDHVSAQPQLAEMLYLVVMQIAGGETAKWLHAAMFVLALAALAVTLELERRNRIAAMIAPLMLVASPVVIAPAGAAFIDSFALFHVVASAMLLFTGASPLLVGATMAAAFATKITTGPAIAGLVIWYVGRALAPSPALRAPSPRSRGEGLGEGIAALLLPIAIAYAPFAIRNIEHTGDPIFPTGYTILHRDPPGIAPDRVRYTTEFHSRLGGPLGIGWFPRPDVEPDEVAGGHHVVGLFAIAIAITDRRSRRWLALIIPYLALALAIHPPTRYLIPMFAGLAALEAIALTTILRRRWIVQLVSILLVVVPLFAVASLLLVQFHPFDLILDRISREGFLASRLPAYRAARMINTLPAGKVLALDFPAVYYLDRPWLTEGVLNDPPLREWIAGARNVDDVIRQLRDQAIRYIAVTPGYGGGTPAALFPLARNRHDAVIVGALRRRLFLVGRVDGVDLFALR